MTVAAALAALALFVTAGLGGREPDAARRRLERLVARRVAGARRAVPSLWRRLDRQLTRVQVMALVEKRVRQAGLPLTASEAVLAVAAFALPAAGAAGVLRGLAAAAAASALSAGLAWCLLGVMRDRRSRRVDRQLPAALDLLAGQLRGHRSVVEGIAEASARLAGPLRDECARVAEELRLGIPLPQALDALRRRVPSRPLAAMVGAILMADATGGDLADCLSRQARALRDQVAFAQEVRALTAHARATATVLALLPAGVAAAMFALDPSAMAPMVASRGGRTLLAAAAVLEATGWFVMRAMIRKVAP